MSCSVRGTTCNQDSVSLYFCRRCRQSHIIHLTHVPNSLAGESDTAIHFCQSTLVVDPTWLVGYHPLVTCRFFALRASRIERTVAPNAISCVIAQLLLANTAQKKLRGHVRLEARHSLNRFGKPTRHSSAHNRITPRQTSPRLPRAGNVMRPWASMMIAIPCFCRICSNTVGILSLARTVAARRVDARSSSAGQPVESGTGSRWECDVTSPAPGPRWIATRVLSLGPFAVSRYMPASG